MNCLKQRDYILIAEAAQQRNINKSLICKSKKERKQKKPAENFCYFLSVLLYSLYKVLFT